MTTWLGGVYRDHAMASVRCFFDSMHVSDRHQCICLSVNVVNRVYHSLVTFSIQYSLSFTQRTTAATNPRTKITNLDTYFTAAKEKHLYNRGDDTKILAPTHAHPHSQESGKQQRVRERERERCYDDTGGRTDYLNYTQYIDRTTTTTRWIEMETARKGTGRWL